MEVLILENRDGSDRDRILRQKAAPVKDIDAGIRQLAGDMLDAMRRDKGVGLAAPQVGCLRRLFVTHAEGDQPRVFINPSIIWTSQDEVNYEEGCLSLPGLWAEIRRPESVKIQAWNEKGRAFTLEAAGVLARVIQHEYDHLEGILFIDRVNEARREKLLARLAKKQGRTDKKRKIL
ncbi:MAG: peptide deformylase [Treponema sp.]|jgi:peptide deformylase|nr:peptide deformylase [Treponema sp.]